jgi:hypothetical protein
VRPLCQEFQDPIWTYYRKTLIREIDAISPLSAPLGRQGKWRVDADAFGFLFSPHLPTTMGASSRFRKNWRLFRDEKLCYLNPLVIFLRTIAA